MKENVGKTMDDLKKTYQSKIEIQQQKVVITSTKCDSLETKIVLLTEQMKRNIPGFEKEKLLNDNQQINIDSKFKQVESQIITVNTNLGGAIITLVEELK